MKALFLKFKIYFIIAALLSIVIGTWKVRGWYEADLHKDALLEQKKQYEKQARVDAVGLAGALKKERAARRLYRGLRDEANKTELCTNGGNDFLRLFNRGANNANAAE